MALADQVKRALDRELAPAGYNVGAASFGPKSGCRFQSNL
jgi:hypothetical protein